MKKTFVLFLAIFISLVSSAQVENVVLTMHLKNGDIITGKTDIAEISLKTSYGTLKFPVGDINSINIGIHNSDIDKGKLLGLLEQLEAGTSREKESAFDKVIKMSQGAIPFIKSYMQNSKQINIKEDISLATLYEVMLAKHKVTKNYSLYDEVVFNGKNSVEGTYDFQELLIVSDYGRIRINRKDIESIDVKILAEEGFDKDNTFKLFANQFVTGNKESGWLNTGILVKKGQQVKITSDGMITLASLSGGTYSSDGGINGAPGPSDRKVNYGQVLYKIGQNTKLKKAGENISFSAENTGIIFLSIFETVFNSANTGYYTTKVKVK